MVQWSGLCTPLQGCVCLVTQSFLTLCDPTHCRPPGSSVHGILQARILEGLPFLPPGDILDPGIEPASAVSPALQAILYALSHQESHCRGLPFNLWWGN